MKFFKKLKNVKIGLLIFMIIAVVLAFLLKIYKTSIFIGLIWLDIIAFMIIYFLYYRCPYCGGHLGKKYNDRNKCRHCGKKLM